MLDAEEQCDVLWVTSRCRRKGLGSAYVAHFKWTTVPLALEGAVSFWKQMQVAIKRVEHEESTLHHRLGGVAVQ